MHDSGYDNIFDFAAGAVPPPYAHLINLHAREAMCVPTTAPSSHRIEASWCLPPSPGETVAASPRASEDEVTAHDREASSVPVPHVAWSGPLTVWRSGGVWPHPRATNYGLCCMSGSTPTAREVLLRTRSFRGAQRA